MGVLRLPPPDDTVSLLHSSNRASIANQAPAANQATLPDWRQLVNDNLSPLCTMGFFCRKELELERSTHLPLRFRLGSLAEVNRLEGKPGW
jgi:hypothetical protein